MADQKKWFKVWASILTDPKFLNMSLEDIGSWVLLGAMICQQGTKGKLEILPPSELLIMRFKSVTFDGLKKLLKALPNVHLTEHFPANDGFTVTLLNWYKYQIDSTVAERVTRLRRKRRGEETLTTTSTSTSSALRASRLGGAVATREKSGGENERDGTIRSKSISEQVAERRRAQEIERIRSLAPKSTEHAQQVFNRLRDLPKIPPEA